MAFTLDPGLDHAAACAAIGKAMLAGQLTAPDAVPRWPRGRSPHGGGAPQVHQDRKGRGVLLLGQERGGNLPQRDDRQGRLGADCQTAGQIVAQWDQIPLSSTAKLTLENPEAAKKKKAEYLAKRAERQASAAA